MNPKPETHTMTGLYDADFHAWTQQQAELLRDGQLQALDLDHLAEEIESMGASERRELGSRLNVLLTHLLKYRFQPDQRSSGWVGTINEQRNQLERLLEQSPSLRRLLPEALTAEYRRARRDAARETGLARDSFPEACPFGLEQALDPDYWP